MHKYIQIDLERLFIQKRELSEKYNRFSKELIVEEYVPYTDDIGLYEYSEEGERVVLTSEQIRKKLRMLRHPIYKFRFGED